MFSLRDEFGAVGPAPPAPRAVVALQRPARCPASTSGCSRCPTGPSWTSGTTSRREEIDAARRSTTPTSARSFQRHGHVADRRRVGRPEGRRDASRRRRSATARSATCPARAPSSPTRPRCDAVITEIALSRLTERGATRADDRLVRGRDGRPQARGVLLMIRPLQLTTAECSSRRRCRPTTPAALRHRRVRRRRQVHPGRPAAARLQVGADRHSSTPSSAASRKRGLDSARPGAADRRPAGRARAGHHHRRRLPLLRHPAAAVHPGRHPRPRAVHPQHGDGRLHRRPGRGPGRRPQRRHRADPPARRGGRAAARAARACWRSTRSTWSTSTRRSSPRSPPNSPRTRSELGVPEITAIPISALDGDNVVEPSAPTWTGTAAPPCWSTWRRSRSATT